MFKYINLQPVQRGLEPADVAVKIIGLNGSRERGTALCPLQLLAFFIKRSITRRGSQHPRGFYGIRRLNMAQHCAERIPGSGTFHPFFRQDAKQRGGLFKPHTGSLRSGRSGGDGGLHLREAGLRRGKTARQNVCDAPRILIGQSIRGLRTGDHIGRSCRVDIPRQAKVDRWRGGRKQPIGVKAGLGQLALRQRHRIRRDAGAGADLPRLLSDGLKPGVALLQTKVCLNGRHLLFKTDAGSHKPGRLVKARFGHSHPRSRQLVHPRDNAFA